MSSDSKRRETLRSKANHDSNLGKASGNEKETGSKLVDTGAIEHFRPANKREVSPNTPSGEES